MKELSQNIFFKHEKISKFKTNLIEIDFETFLSKKNISVLNLVGEMLTSVNGNYPTNNEFQNKLSSLYGANFSYSVVRKGYSLHLILYINYLSDSASSHNEEDVIKFVENNFKWSFTRIENKRELNNNLDKLKEQMISQIETSLSDPSFYANYRIQQLFFSEKNQSDLVMGDTEVIKETSIDTVIKSYYDLIHNSKIHIASTGTFSENKAVQFLKLSHLYGRTSEKHNLFYQQGIKPSEFQVVEKGDINQTKFRQMYHLNFDFKNKLNIIKMSILNELLGLSPLSLLFSIVREKHGYAYSISSNFNISNSSLIIQAGIDYKDEEHVSELIKKIFSTIKNKEYNVDLLETIKKNYLNNLLIREDSYVSVTNQNLNNLIVGREVSFNEIKEVVERIDQDDLSELLNKINLQTIFILRPKNV